MRLLPVIAALCLLLSGCKNTFNVNEDWQEIPIIYGLLGYTDSLHAGGDSTEPQVVKINRAFLNENADAYGLAKVEDSLYYLDSIDVRLIGYRGNDIADEAVLTRQQSFDKPGGVFSSPSQYLYFTKNPYRIDPSLRYQIYMYNPQTKHVAFGYSTVVGPLKPVYPTPGSSAIAFLREQNTPFAWKTGVNARFYDMTIMIKVLERTKGSGNPWDTLTVRWPIITFRLTDDLRGNTDMKQNVPGSNFFNIIADQLEVNSQKEHKIAYMDIIWDAGGEEIYNYINANQAGIGVVQKVPDYTNITGGVGIFSSRAKSVIRIGLNVRSVEALQADPETRGLNFVK